MEKNIFSIYKIDLKKVEKKICSKIENPTFKALFDVLISRVGEIVEEKSGGYINAIDYPGFKGVVYRTEAQPKWKKLIENMSAHIEIEGVKQDVSWIVNTNVSYILFHECNEQIYAVTGGYGHSVIKEYIERNWGLYLVTKFVQKDDAIIRELRENYLFGNTSTLSKANRNNTFSRLHNKRR